ncbi:MAG: S41 family peptidase [Clostridia bacterium]|nr:S41 family peptidase [Clostridia bacterium]
MKNKEERATEFKKSKKYEILKIVIVIILTAIITYFCTITITLKSYLNGSDLTYLSTKLSLIKQKLENIYIYDINEEKMIENAIKGYVEGMDDKYTQYLTTEEMTSLMEETAGNYVGIGVYLANNTADNTIIVIGVIEGSVSEQVGLQAGDIIKKVDGIEYSGEQLDSATDVLKGEEGTNVNITIIRNSEEKEFTIKRSNIRIKAVSSEMKNNNIGYIKISSFNEGTSEEFIEAYENLKKENPSGLVIDLRNNGGGLVSESLKVAETMVEKGKTLLITANKQNKEEIKKSQENPIINIPVTVLINQNTASASEILAGILRDNCNYKIIGTTSYGKGVIQTVYSFTDGSGLKITSEEYFTPNHSKIDKVGISPDIEVKLDSEWENISNVPYENDLQLQAAINELK